ncbi:MAG: hypothetical protein ACK4XJ_10300 [Fimbriimonadaceae bacterium]
MTPKSSDSIATIFEPSVKLTAPVLLVNAHVALTMLGLKDRRTLDRLPIPRIKLPGVNRVLYRVADIEAYVASLM